MAFPRGLLTSYSISDNKIHLDDIFQEMKIPETPLLNVIRTGEKLDSTILQWYDDVPMPLSTTLNGAYTSGGGSLTVTDSTFFKKGNIIRVDNVLYRITDINTTTHVLTVTALNTDADHADGATVTLISDAQLEASSPEDSSVGIRVQRENVTQIFTEYLKLSGTQREVKQWVRNYNLWSDEIAKKLAKLRIMMERTLINGIYNKPSDNTTPRLAGGIEYYVGNNGYCATGTLNETNFKAVLKELYNLNSFGIQVWMHPSTKEDFINQLLYDKVIVQREDEVAGRKVQTYVCEYGEFGMYISPHISTDVIYFFNPSAIEIRPLRPFAVEELAKTGDFVQVQIVGEYSFKISNSSLMGKFTKS